MRRKGAARVHHSFEFAIGKVNRRLHGNDPRVGVEWRV
jgi:hypothetical protein